MSSSQNEPKANFLCFHADILDRVCFSYQYFRQGSIFVLRKILDRVGFEHQVSTYPYENDRSTPSGPGDWSIERLMQVFRVSIVSKAYLKTYYSY